MFAIVPQHAISAVSWAVRRCSNISVSVRVSVYMSVQVVASVSFNKWKKKKTETPKRLGLARCLLWAGQICNQVECGWPTSCVNERMRTAVSNPLHPRDPLTSCHQDTLQRLLAFLFSSGRQQPSCSSSTGQIQNGRPRAYWCCAFALRDPGDPFFR